MAAVAAVVAVVAGKFITITTKAAEAGSGSAPREEGGGGGGGGHDGGGVVSRWVSPRRLWDAAAAGADDAGVPWSSPVAGGGGGDPASPPTPPYGDGDDRGGELCRWVPSDSAESSSSSSGADATTTVLVWSAMTILACVPMTLSSIYKEMKLGGGGGGGGIDPIFLNGWVAVFQLLFSIVLSVPAGMTSDPPVTPRMLPGNIMDGMRCYLGTGTIASGCHTDDGCHEAPLYVNVFLVFNVGFNMLIVYILK